MPEQVRCPSCNAALRVPDNLLGKNVKCPKCQTTFMAEREEPDERERVRCEPAPSAARRRPKLLEEIVDEEEELPPEEEEYEEEQERPRRRRRGRRRRYAEAELAVAGPAIAIMIVSGLAIAVSILSLLLNMLGAGILAAAQRGHRQQQEDLVINAVAGVSSAIFGLCYYSIVTIGAVKMKNLSSYGFAMASCIMAMLPCSLCCLLGLPFGIWGLVILSKPEVKDAFS